MTSLSLYSCVNEHKRCHARLVSEALLCNEILATPRWRMQA